VNPADNYRDHFTTVCARFDRALDACGFDTLLLYSGAPQRWYRDDLDYPFRCNPQFRHLVPVSQPHSWVLYRSGRRPALLYHLPRDYWHHVAPLPDAFWTGHFDVQPIAAPEDARDLLPAGPRVAVLGDAGPAVTDWQLGAINPAPLLNLLEWERAYKTAYEQDCLRIASHTAARGHRAAAAAFREGLSEFEINLRYLEATGQGSDELPYTNIVALNRNAATLHHTVLGKARPGPGKLLSFLLDAGADCNGYGSDITRTHCGSGNGPFTALLSAVDSSQQDLVSRVRAGRSFVDLHLQMHTNTAAILVEFGLLRCSAESAVDSGLTRHFLPHGLGHHLGLQVHDVGGHQAGPEGGIQPPPADHPYLRNTRPLEEKQVLTIEPGLYFIDLLLEDLRNSALANEVNWSRVEQFHPFGGVRVEDNVLVGPGGAENLTRDAFAALGSD
jgi:Xaa-Pro dipeptidase